MKIIVVSGGFDPIHSGHIAYFKSAKEHGDKLIVALNSDKWLENKKGKAFMPFIERKEIIENFIEEVKNNNTDLQSVKKELIVKSFVKKAKIINSKTLSQTQMNLIIDRLFACKNPKYSPDGKQNYIELGIDKVENLF